MPLRNSSRAVDDDGAPILLSLSSADTYAYHEAYLPPRTLRCPRGRIGSLLHPSGAIRRTIIRHLVLILDLSASMTDRDMRPSRFELALQCSREFIVEWFDQNPLGQIAVVAMRSGLGERVCEMTGKWTYLTSPHYSHSGVLLESLGRLLNLSVGPGCGRESAGRSEGYCGQT